MPGKNLEVETSFFQEIQDGSVHQIAQIGTTFLKHEETINIYEEPTLEIALNVLSKSSQGNIVRKNCRCPDQIPAAVFAGILLILYKPEKRDCRLLE